MAWPQSFSCALPLLLAALLPLPASAAASAEQELQQVVDALRSGRSAPLSPEARRAVAAPQRVAAAPTVRLQELVEEAQLRLAPPKVPPGTLPGVLLKLADEHRYAVVVDLPRARLYVLENNKGTLKIVREHYAAMGKNGVGKQNRGDLRTPIGIYTVTGFTDDKALPDKYGSGAFPLTYPNIWDRHHGRDGSGIWLHGVPLDVGSRAPRSSEGCVTMANSDLVALKPYLQAGKTPVLLADSLSWLPAAVIAKERDALLARIESWRNHWSAIDTEGYLDFYASDFVSNGMNKSAFSAYKRRVNGSKKRINVQLRELDLMRYPGESNLIVAQFRQDYTSDNFSVSGIKQQFWRQQQDGSWKIVLEES